MMPWLSSDSWWSVTAPLTTGSAVRTPQLLDRVVDQFDVENHQRYQRPAGGETQCDTFLSDVTTALGCTIPSAELMLRLPGECEVCHHQPKAKSRIVELDANATAEWLAGVHGQRHGWVSCDEKAARAAADAGYPVAVTWSNPGGIGHVAVGVPAPGGWPAEKLCIAAAGAHNFRRCLVSQSFGSAPVRYFTHA